MKKLFFGLVLSLCFAVPVFCGGDFSDTKSNVSTVDGLSSDYVELARHFGTPETYSALSVSNSAGSVCDVQFSKREFFFVEFKNLSEEVEKYYENLVPTHIISSRPKGFLLKPGKIYIQFSIYYDKDKKIVGYDTYLFNGDVVKTIAKNPYVARWAFFDSDFSQDYANSTRANFSFTQNTESVKLPDGFIEIVKYINPEYTLVNEPVYLENNVTVSYTALYDFESVNADFRKWYTNAVCNTDESFNGKKNSGHYYLKLVSRKYMDYTPNYILTLYCDKDSFTGKNATMIIFNSLEELQNGSFFLTRSEQINLIENTFSEIKALTKGRDNSVLESVVYYYSPGSFRMETYGSYYELDDNLKKRILGASSDQPTDLISHKKNYLQVNLSFSKGETEAYRMYGNLKIFDSTSSRWKDAYIGNPVIFSSLKELLD